MRFYGQHLFLYSIVDHIRNASYYTNRYGLERHSMHVRTFVLSYSYISKPSFLRQWKHGINRMKHDYVKTTTVVPTNVLLFFFLRPWIIAGRSSKTIARAIPSSEFRSSITTLLWQPESQCVLVTGKLQKLSLVTMSIAMATKCELGPKQTVMNQSQLQLESL